jgi:hypothetical protein
MKSVGTTVVLWMACLIALASCTTLLETTPPRTAKEQLMLSRAVRDSVADWQMPELADRRVHVDAAHLESFDRGFVLGEMRDWVGRQGAMLVDDEQDAEVRLEVRSGALGMEQREALIGIPALVIPVPMMGPMQTPELAVFKDARRKGLASLSVTAFDVQTGRRLFGDQGRIGQTYQADAVLLFIPVSRVRHNLPPEVELTRPQ